jgi:hypothetical protein
MARTRGRKYRGQTFKASNTEMLKFLLHDVPKAYLKKNPKTTLALLGLGGVAGYKAFKKYRSKRRTKSYHGHCGCGK